MKKRRSNKSVSPGVTRLGDVLPQLIAKYGLQQRRNIEEIAEAWQRTVGEPYAFATRISGLSRGTLEITVPHNAFIQELSFRQAELLREMQNAVIGEKIKRLKFIVL
jgi:predicted nucleic acid-binding Zn ribbon protein